ncbi:hypothetical protein FP76_gp021 [Bacillus phage Evoli]|uniref:Uncharacterized protein n=2 Tax=Bastillevirus evoli TaxID=2560330 RepID=A0A024B000_9CAUD|nr:hypothetical protein FP76_gp021 [Bacillus phage Evoli]AHZ09745.1 hypothetical protein [Bacillus phage Evoli]AMW61774.1 hypothetical protein DNAM5_23 [Bacillus phage Vinny]
MTKHTRNRQLVKLGDGFMWRTTVPIDMIRNEHKVWGLDPKFEWRRVPMWKIGNKVHQFNYIRFTYEGSTGKYVDKDERIIVMPVVGII